MNLEAPDRAYVDTAHHESRSVRRLAAPARRPLLVLVLLIATLGPMALAVHAQSASGAQPAGSGAPAAGQPFASQPASITQPRGITATIARWATDAIGAVGYVGVFVAMAAESMVFPIPAEGVMPFAGFLVADGRFSLAAVIVIAILGSLTGSVVSWFIGKWGGRPFVLQFGKWVLLDRRDLELTERYFSRRGEVTILIGRFIPVVRHLISIPAGLAEMNLPRFMLFTVIGAGIYDSFLAVAGLYLKEHWDRIMRYSHQIDIVVVAIIAVLVVWYLLRHVRRLVRDRRAETEGRA